MCKPAHVHNIDRVQCLALIRWECDDDDYVLRNLG